MIDLCNKFNLPCLVLFEEGVWVNFITSILCFVWQHDYGCGSYLVCNFVGFPGLKFCCFWIFKDKKTNLKTLWVFLKKYVLILLVLIFFGISQFWSSPSLLCITPASEISFVRSTNRANTFSVFPNRTTRKMSGCHFSQ